MTTTETSVDLRRQLVYPGGAGLRVQVIGSSCAAPETELIASFTDREVGLLIAALQATV